MSDTNTFKCSCCGEMHNSWPALTFKSPDPYLALPEEDKETLTEKNADFCIIRHAEQTEYYIRCVLRQKINNSCQNLDYGVWVSLSERSFNDYYQNYDNPDHQATYFGWLCNDIWGYEFNDSIPADVITQSEGKRPEVIPHDACDHAFVRDYYQGISVGEAERRIREMVGE